ncbi:hypothetical protein B0H13DRAFT_1850149 [Mycena leptocephala]|nr:hypothetical protein B0H13DRAFT_1850149 [Mycena leptocephala]
MGDGASLRCHETHCPASKLNEQEQPGDRLRKPAAKTRDTPDAAAKMESDRMKCGSFVGREADGTQIDHCGSGLQSAGKIYTTALGEWKLREARSVEGQQRVRQVNISTGCDVGRKLAQADLSKVRSEAGISSQTKAAKIRSKKHLDMGDDVGPKGRKGLRRSSASTARQKSRHFAVSELASVLHRCVPGQSGRLLQILQGPSVCTGCAGRLRRPSVVTASHTKMQGPRASRGVKRRTAGTDEWKQRHGLRDLPYFGSHIVFRRNFNNAGQPWRDVEHKQGTSGMAKKGDSDGLSQRHRHGCERCSAEQRDIGTKVRGSHKRRSAGQRRNRRGFP